MELSERDRLIQACDHCATIVQAHGRKATEATHARRDTGWAQCRLFTQAAFFGDFHMAVSITRRPGEGQPHSL